MAAGQKQEVSLQVPMNLIIDQLHAKYGRMIAGLMQENAELQGGVEVLGNENAELKGMLAARDQDPVSPTFGAGTLDLSGSGAV
jgi:hypothetical protein